MVLIEQKKLCHSL